MAQQVPLNNFRLLAQTLDSGSNLIYQELVNNVSTIVLSAQISNLTMTDKQVSVKVQKSGSYAITLLNNATIPATEALNPFSGKVVLEKTDALYFITDISGSLDAVLSVLENSND